MLKIVINLFAVLVITSCILPAEIVSLADNGILISGGADAQYILSYPLLVNAEKKNIKIAEKKTGQKSATILYEGGGRIDLEIEDNGITMRTSAIPDGIKMLYVTISIKNDIRNGGKWLIGPGEPKEFPMELPAKASLFLGSANDISVISASGDFVSLRFPNGTYQQLQDNRKWDGDVFVWNGWLLNSEDALRISVNTDNAIGAVPAKAPPLHPAQETMASTPFKKDVVRADAEILKWKDGKRAVFLLLFDDSCESQVKNAIPELKKRDMVGTFYICPGKAPFQGRQEVWEKEIPSDGMEYGNHTFSHKGATSVEDLDKELMLCNEEIAKCFPARKMPRLISFAQPGGGLPWNVSDDEKKQLLAKYNLINRPAFSGYPFPLKTKGDVLKLVDTTVINGDMGHIDNHGVGGDWLAIPMDIFTALLDKLAANREHLWITDPISYYKYLSERKGSELKIVQKGDDAIQLSLPAVPIRCCTIYR